MDETTLEAHLATIEEQGYCIIEDVISPALLTEIKDVVNRLEDELEIAPRGNYAELAR